MSNPPPSDDENSPSQKTGVNTEHDLDSIDFHGNRLIDGDAYQSVDHGVGPDDKTFRKQGVPVRGNTHLRKPVRDLCNIVQRKMAIRTSPAAATALTDIERDWT